MATVQAALERRGSRQKVSARTRRRIFYFYLFITPWLLGLVFLTVLPLVLGFLTSLTNYDGLNLANIKFVGLSNYSRAFNDTDARFSMSRTLVWSGANLPIWIVLSLILALVLNQNIRARGFFRTLFYLPSFIPVVPMVWIWKIFLDKNTGLLNTMISLFRPGTAIAWLSAYALAGLTAIAVFTGIGWGMIVFLAALQDTPDELVEAARIDGANSWQVFRYVIFPLLTPVIFFVGIMGLIGSFQQFIYPMLLGTGTAQLSFPPRDVYLYMLFTYRQIFTYQRFGYGTALLWLLFLVIMGLTWLIFRTQRYWVYSESDAAEEAKQ